MLLKTLLENDNDSSIKLYVFECSLSNKKIHFFLFDLLIDILATRSWIFPKILAIASETVRSWSFSYTLTKVTFYSGLQHNTVAREVKEKAAVVTVLAKETKQIDSPIRLRLARSSVVGCVFATWAQETPKLNAKLCTARKENRTNWFNINRERGGFSGRFYQFVL